MEHAVLMGLIVVLICVALSVIVGVLVGWYSEDRPLGMWTGGVCVAVVLTLWLVIAVPYSAWERNNCAARADGYGLDDFDWSIRRDCRVYLHTGQLVPEDRIRITTDGQIVISEDGDS